MAPLIDFNSKKVKTRMGFINGFGAAIVVIGALFKILHLPGGDVVIGLGLTVEALLFMIGAFEPIPIHYHWENVHPQLLDDNHNSHHNSKENEYDYTSIVSDYSSKKSSYNDNPNTKRMYNASSNIDLNSDIIEKLENSVKNFTKILNTFSQIESISQLNQKVNDYSNQMDLATRTISKLNQSYSDKMVLSDNYVKVEGELINVISNSVGVAKGVRGEMEILKGNINSLNSVYGGMLSLINK